ncbi:PilN domain-containing protein [Methylosinus sporium]|uniref:PilN domain-containing protein n=1 Tax=Methylosinus sporium TaxID=428 RepID=A0A549SDP3_METSR|nr:MULTISPECIES: PilN domain-containing protein [Methylosinus]MBU3887021.1 PilN domain-containing protein [Methylosinus sp. KRF6]TRL26593.1 PilN domain-containing protein [Methylosinus sporium]
MSGSDFIIRWIDALAKFAERSREIWRSRGALFVSRENGGFLIRSAADPGAPVLAASAAGPFSEDIQRRARREIVLLEWPQERVVTRRIALPAKAQEFLRGVVDNRLDRLSPWPVAQVFYGLAVVPGEQPATLDVRVSIVARGEIEAACAELAARGLAVDRVVAASADKPASEAPVVLWSRNMRQAAEDRGRLRLVIGGGLAAYVALCAGLGLWATFSAASLQEENETLAARARAMQKQARAGEDPRTVAALGLPERAWARKEMSISAVHLLESLSRSLPDGAYLTELRFEADKLRIAGLVEDAPPLIAALEASGPLSQVRFSAPTTRGPDGRLFSFSIEAQVAARLALTGG